MMNPIPEPTPAAAKKWVSYMPTRTPEQMRQKWNDCLKSARMVIPYEEPEPDQQHWHGHGYLFILHAGNVIDVYPWRPHRYRQD